MQEFLNWTIDTIREDRLLGSWLEEKKFEWTSIVSKFLSNIIDNNCSVIIITDSDREWFLEYLLSNINSSKEGRPYFPFYDFRSIYGKFGKMNSDLELDLLKDMLSISFPNGYCFWYIGKSNHKRANIAKVSNNSFMWIMDENMQNAFNLQSTDEAIDLKLIQMFRLFNKTLSATLFAEIAMDC